MKFVKIIAALPLLAACAAQPETIAPAYVSPAAYSTMSCAQLNAEAARVSSRLSAATGQQAQQANNDAAMTAVALVLFWPAAFAIGNKDQSGTIAQLRGEAEALQSAATRRGC